MGGFVERIGSYNVIFRLHEADWIVKGSDMPASRAELMIALQKVQQILIRTSDTEEATRQKTKRPEYQP